MPVLRPSGSDFTSFVKAAAQYVPSGGGGKVSKSGGVSVALPGLGAVVRTSQVGALASPRTSAVIINGITPKPIVASAVVPAAIPGIQFTIAATSSYIASYTSSGVVSWATSITAPVGASPSLQSSSVDSSDNIFACGTYSGTITFNNADGTIFGTLSPVSTGNDCFIAKYSSSGVVQWVASIGGVGNDNPVSIAVDASGNVFCVGLTFASTVTSYGSDGSAFSPTLSYPGGGTIRGTFIVKYSSSGTVLWNARLAGGTGNGVYPQHNVSVDSSGNLILTGAFSATATAYNYDGTSFATSLTYSNGTSAAFVIKYSASGSVLWVARSVVSLGGTGILSGYSTSTDSSGNIYTSIFTNSCTSITLYNGDTTQYSTFTPTFSGYSILLKYNSAGTIQWIVQLVGTSTIYGLTNDSSGNVYASSFIPSSVTVRNSDNTTVFKTLTAINGRNTSVFVKYNTNGIAQMAFVTHGGPTGNAGHYISVESSGDIILVGNGGDGGTVSIYDSTDQSFATSAPVTSGKGITIIVKYNSSGVGQWVARVGGPGYASASRNAPIISTGNIVITGTLSTTAGTYTIYNAGS